MNDGRRILKPDFPACPWTTKDVFIAFIYSIAVFFVLIFWLSLLYFFFNLFVQHGPEPFGAWKAAFKEKLSFWLLIFFYVSLFITLKVKIFDKHNVRAWDLLVRPDRIRQDIFYGIATYLKFLAVFLLVSFLFYLAATMWDMVFGTSVVERVNVFFIASHIEKSSMEAEAKNIGIVSVSLFLVLAPFFEELFFRGCLYSALRQRFSRFFSIVSSSFIFSVLHGYFFLFLYVFFVGVILAYMFEKRRSLVAPLVFHMLNNLTVILLLFL